MPLLPREDSPAAAKCCIRELNPAGIPFCRDVGSFLTVYPSYLPCGENSSRGSGERQQSIQNAINGSTAPDDYRPHIYHARTHTTHTVVRACGLPYLQPEHTCVNDNHTRRVRHRTLPVAVIAVWPFSTRGGILHGAGNVVRANAGAKQRRLDWVGSTCNISPPSTVCVPLDDTVDSVCALHRVSGLSASSLT